MTTPERIRAALRSIRESLVLVDDADWPYAPQPYAHALQEYHAELELSRMWRSRMRDATARGDAQAIAICAHARFDQALCTRTARERLHACRLSNFARAA